MESTETISAPRRSATAIPASVLPAAVGPTSARSGRFGAGRGHQPTAAGSRCSGGYRSRVRVRSLSPPGAPPRARRPDGAGGRPRSARRGTFRAHVRRRRGRRGCVRVRPARRPCGRCPSISTSTDEPTCSRIRSSAIDSWSATRRSNRSWTTGLSSCPSISAARVPGRGEYWNVYAWSNRARRTTSSVSSEVLLGLAGEPDDDVGAHRDVRDGGADPLEPAEVALAPVRTLHRLQHAVRSRLEREVDVLAHLVALGHRVDHVGREVVRVRAREPDPAEPVDPFTARSRSANSGRRGESGTVRSRPYVFTF